MSTAFHTWTTPDDGASYQVTREGFIEIWDEDAEVWSELVNLRSGRPDSRSLFDHAIRLQASVAGVSDVLRGEAHRVRQQEVERDRLNELQRAAALDLKGVDQWKSSGSSSS